MVDFFTRLTSSSEWERLKLDGVPFERFSEDKNVVLVRSFDLVGEAKARWA